jgi:hypothetical protein
MDERFVEQIVRQVMARLGGTPLDGAAAEDPPAGGAGSSTDRLLVLDEPVVTAETLIQRLNGHRKVALGRRTVLTPAALDVLSSERIEWTRGAVANRTPSGTTTGFTWAAIVSRTTPAVERLLGEEASAGQWQYELVGTAAEAAERAVSCLCRGEAAGCVVFADGPEAVACRANRNASVRAASAAGAPGVVAAVRSIGVNLICIDPDGMSYFELRNVLRAFTAAGRPRAPAGWSEP